MSTRRGFLGGSLATAAIGGVAWVAPGVASGQPRAGGCPGIRDEWTRNGPPDGREPVDATAPTDEERIHIPVLSLPRTARPGRPFDLVVRIGLVAHPMDADHHIQWIEVRIGDQRVWVIDLGAAVPYPVVRVPIVLAAAGTITVRARCSRHRIWRTRHAVTV